MESSTCQQPCQKCGIPPGAVILYIDGIRMCTSCYAELLAKKNTAAIYRDIRDQHGKTLDKLGEL